MVHNFVRIQGYQQLVNYRVVDTYGPRETYILPQLSTIIGMVQSEMGWEEYHPVDIAVLAKEAPVCDNLQTFYYFSSLRFEGNTDKNGNPKRGRHQEWAINKAGNKIGLTRGVGSVKLIGEIKLDIYLSYQNEEDNEKVYKNLENPDTYPSLGRWEDLIDITKVSIGVTQEGDILSNDNLTYANGANMISYTYVDKYPIYKSYSHNSKSSAREFNTVNVPVVKGVVGNGEQYEGNLLQFN